MTSPPMARDQSLAAAWLGVVGLMNGLYLYGAVADRGFGINALHGLTVVQYGAAVAAVVIGAVLVARNAERARLDGVGIAITAALVALPVFLALRSNFLNPDGRAFAAKFERDVPRIGAHITHDEMLELFIHSRVWYYTHRWWDWTVVWSYQVLSCVAGAVFVFAVFRLARRVSTTPLLFVAGVLSGGYMQLFFGDVENYTMLAALVVVYLILAVRYMRQDTGILAPATMLAVAACFHLEAAFLGPSLLFLLWTDYRRTGSVSGGARAVLTAAAIVAATTTYFHFHGLPIDAFWTSHAGTAVNSTSKFAIGVPLSYWVHQASLTMLLCPAVLMFIPLAWWRRFEFDPAGQFLAVAAACMLVFQVMWRAQLGVYNDWNLYATATLVVSVFLWRTIANAATTPALRAIAAAMAATGWLHSYAWIAANHAGR